MRSIILLWLMLAAMPVAAQVHPVYVVLWFDTEDFVDPRSDDAALEIARRLTNLGVRATFKVVGEKARVLEQRGRRDVIEALRRHDVGSHGNYHSLHPAPAEYLEHLDLAEGGDHFYAHEISGVRDLTRIFGQPPSCNGQPGGSFAPHKYLAFRRLGIPVYFDSASQINLDNQPFWYEGILTVLTGGNLLVRPRLDSPPGIAEGKQAFERAYEELQSRGGGFISTVYHPTEFVNAQFWDAVNFSKGANPPRKDWKMPPERTPAEIERGYQVLEEFVRYILPKPGVQVITVADFARIYSDHSPGRRVSAAELLGLAKKFESRLDFARIDDYAISAAESLSLLTRWALAAPAERPLGMAVEPALAPIARGQSGWEGATVTVDDLLEAARWAEEHVRENGRLPSQVWFGIHRLSIEDYAGTLAGWLAAGAPASGEVAVKRPACGFCERVTTDDRRPFGWVIHPEGFRGTRILDLSRVLAWSIKPALLPGSSGVK